MLLTRLPKPLLTVSRNMMFMTVPGLRVGVLVGARGVAQARSVRGVIARAAVGRASAAPHRARAVGRAPTAPRQP
eukprot:1190962-Alexandrium_andersonii.AAC.1